MKFIWNNVFHYAGAFKHLDANLQLAIDILRKNRIYVFEGKLIFKDKSFFLGV